MENFLETDKIRDCISSIPFVKKVYYLVYEEYLIKGKVEISFDELISLDIEVLIKPQYPLKDHNSESIKFINKDLIKYKHVMGDGAICIHTSHCTELEQKLFIDFQSLKNWIIKYYINSDFDENYEHIIVPESLINDEYSSYIFAETKKSFKKGEFGIVRLRALSRSIYKNKLINNFLVQRFESDNRKTCNWSEYYRDTESTDFGYYIFIENAPATYNRFIFENWLDFNNLLPDDFIKELHKRDSLIPRTKNVVLPLFIGYNTINEEIHWQVALLESGRLPFKGVPVKLNGVKTGKWKGELISQKVNWAISNNASYSYYFGRGSFSTSITEKNILIIGIGAIGSILSKTLVRCGCKHIDITDFDTKQPENVCRSEYGFIFGLCDKVEELKNILNSISPHCDIRIVDKEYFETIIKVLHKNEDAKNKLCNQINNYDFVFDCTTDNDLMYILNSLELSCTLINMSITNYAKELVCAFYPNIYSFVINQFENILINDTSDLHRPTGCWDPTFKASYNDIDLLVQMGLKHINHVFSNNSTKNNFVVTFENSNATNIKIKEF